MERVGERLAGVDAAAGEQPVLLAGLLVAAEQHAVAPAQDCGDADPRLGPHQTRDEPNPRTPRSLSGSSSTSTRSTSGTATSSSWAIRMPGSTVNAAPWSVLSRI